MSNLVETRKRHTKWGIKQNPTEIIINRTENKDAGGYFEKVETELQPQTVRIFVSGSSSPQFVSTLAGEKQVDRYFGLLADYEADIKADTNTTDKFEADGMEFEVKAVYPQSINGELVGYQGELERVK